MRKRTTVSQMMEASRMWGLGFKRDDIAELVGVNTDTFRSLIAANRDLFPLRRHGEGYWRPIIEESMGENSRDVARRLGVNRQTVNEWRRRFAGA